VAPLLQAPPPLLPVFHLLPSLNWHQLLSLLTPHLLTIPPLLVLPLLLSEHTSVTATHQLHSLFPSSLQAHQNFQQKLLRDRNPGNTHRPLLSLLSLPHGVDTTVAMDLDCGLRHKDHPVMSGRDCRRKDGVSCSPHLPPHLRPHPLSPLTVLPPSSPPLSLLLFPLVTSPPHLSLSLLQLPRTLDQS
jgi:hypothetical protein